MILCASVMESLSTSSHCSTACGVSLQLPLISPVSTCANGSGAGALQSDQFTPSNDGAKFTTPDSARRVAQQRNSSLTPIFHLDLRNLLQILVLSFFTFLTHCTLSYAAPSSSRSSHSICISLSPFLVTSSIPSN